MHQSLPNIRNNVMVFQIFKSCQDSRLNLNNYFNRHVCLSIRTVLSVYASENQLQFLQLHHEMSVIKVSWYVQRVKNKHSRSPSDPLGPGGKANPISAHYNIREAKPNCVYLNSLQCFITSPVLVLSSCVRQHTKDVHAKRVLTSK